MANQQIFYTNKIKTLSGALTASSSATGYPATNLQTDNYAQVWRSTAAGASAEWIKVDLGSAQEIKAISLLNVNARSTSTIVIEGHATDSFGAPTFSQAVTESSLGTSRRNLHHVLATPQTFRWWRITILDNGNPDGFLEVGEWFLGAHIVLTDTSDETSRRRRIRNNVEQRTEENQAYVYARDWHWEFDLTFENVVDATRNELLALDLAVFGNALPFVFVFNPTDPAEAYYVRMGQTGIEDQPVDVGITNISMRLVEESPGLIVPR